MAGRFRDSVLARGAPGEGEMYLVHFNQLVGAAGVPKERRTNYISTTKYNVITFLPLNLFRQFNRMYNLYFLLAAIISLLPLSASPITPVTSVLPLVAVLVVTMIKDAYEDLKRFQADYRANSVQFEVLRNGVPTSILSRSLKPGDVLIVKKNQQIPADLIIVSSSNDDGIAYIATAELDGETNLKRRTTIKAFGDIKHSAEVAKLSGKIECDQPNERLYQYQGRITMNDGSAHSLSADQLLLRGAILRNTAQIYGIVLYVGADTKIMRNLKNSRLKFSTLEAKVNWLVIAIFGLNFAVLLTSAILSGVYQGTVGYRTWWLMNSNSASAEGGLSALAYFVLYTYMIPISLFVTIEISRIVQALFMYSDDEMMSADGIRMLPSNSNLNEDLGRIDHIFSDKTGTLTQNIMSLKYLYVDGKSYAEDGKGTLGKMARGQHEDVTAPEADKLRAFMKSISVCHAVIPSLDENSDKIIYEGDSPDEAALLDGMRPNDIIVTGRSNRDVIVKFLGVEMRWELLNTLEFNSARKRMSVIVRSPEGEIVVFCKGADNIILERTRKDVLKDGELAKLNSTVEDFSRIGLRTLLYAQRVLTKEEYDRFSQDYHKADTSLGEREEKMTQAYELVERNLTLLGATAVEDKLQDEVAETIDYLLNCGIHVWMLTGDKLETAISIGKSTKFLNDSMSIMIVNGDDSQKVGQEFDAHMLAVKAAEQQHVEYDQDIASMSTAAVPLRPKKKLDLSHSATERNALVITGQALIHALKDHPDKFLDLSEKCISVICCRVSPLQKAQVVKLVRRKSNRITLSIGDGANDVSMIQTANIGVGIIGLEGTQAVRASDYAFKEFKALKRLVAVHGRYSFLRMSQLVYFSFYKNIAFIMVTFWWGLYSAWSGQVSYQEIIMTGFNLAITALPPFFICIFEKDLDESVIMKYPESYYEVRAGRYWNIQSIAGWALSAFWHSVVIFFGVYLLFDQGNLGGSLVTYDYWTFTCFLSTYVVITVLSKWSLIIRAWVWPYPVGLLISICIYIVGIFILSASINTYQNAPEAMFGTANVYFGWLLLYVTCFMPDVLAHFYRRTYYPRDGDILQELHVCRPRSAALGVGGLYARKLSSGDGAPAAAVDSPPVNAAMRPTVA